MQQKEGLVLQKLDDLCNLIGIEEEDIDKRIALLKVK